LAGFRSFWFFRGVATWDTPAEFLWEGIDGSRIPAFWLPQGYAVAYGSPPSLPEFTEFMTRQFDSLAPFARGEVRAGPAGADVCEPEEHVPGLVERFNAQPDVPLRLQIAVPTEYEAAVADRERPVIGGELNPIFQGIYSSRIELKQRTRELERLLTTTEKLGVMLRWLGVPVDDAPVWQAWEPMLFNQAHDLMSGVMTDIVYEDTIHAYDFSRRLGEATLEDRLDALVERIDTQGEGTPLLVFNALSWPRTDIVTATVGFTDPGVFGVKVIGPDGAEVPVQILSDRRSGDGAIVEAEIAFVASEVPALGYSLYQAFPLPVREGCPAQQGGVGPLADPVLENEFYRLEVDSLGGAITGLTVKSGDWQAITGPANVVVREADHGDLWEPYHSLDGGSRIAMKDPHPVPARSITPQDAGCQPQAGGDPAHRGGAESNPDEAVYSDQGGVEPGAIRRGPVVSEFTVSHPFGETGTFSTTIRLYAGLRRIDIHTTILNNERFVRYRAMFPVAGGGQVWHEIPFGAIERPAEIEFPAQNWADTGDGTRGLTLLNRGLPGNSTTGGAMLLSLLRSTCIVAYGFGGGYGPGMSSDSGFELGRELGFDYALLPHEGDWREAGVHRAGQEFNNPLIARAVPAHPGELPPKWSFVEVAHPNVIVSTVKLTDGATGILRLYEATGTPAEGVTIRFCAPLRSAEETDLLERPGEPLATEGGVVRLDLGAFEIKTVRFEVGEGEAG
jgi:alpha-mannosidase